MLPLVKQIQEDLQKEVKSYLSSTRMAENTQEAFYFLALGYKPDQVLELEENTAKIDVIRKALTDHRVQIDKFRFDTSMKYLQEGLQVDPSSRIIICNKAYVEHTKNPPKTLDETLKELQPTYIDLLVAAFKDPKERTATKMRIYQELRRLNGDDVEKEDLKANEEVAEESSKEIFDPLGLFKGKVQ